MKRKGSLKILFWVLIVFIFLFAASFLVMPLASQKSLEGKQALLLWNGIWFWTTGLGSLILFGIVNQGRKKQLRGRTNSKNPKVGIIRFFSNAWKKAEDGAFIVRRISLISYRLIAVMLSVFMLVSVLPIDTMLSAAATETDPVFIFKDKNGKGIPGITVTLVETDGESEICSEPSDCEGAVRFVSDRPMTDASYTYTVNAGEYISPTKDASITINDENIPIEITLYAPAPTAETTMAEQKASVGDTVTFQVENVVGIGGLSYQWYKDGILLDDKTSETLTIDQVLMSDAGIYSCEVVSDLSDTDEKLTCEFILSVSKAVPDVNVGITPESGTPYTGTGVTLTAAVSHPENSTFHKPMGEVEFFVDGVSQGTVSLKDGTVTLSSVILTSNVSHSIYAKYSGDDNYTEADSIEISYEVGQISPEEGIHYTKNTPNGENDWYKMGGFLQIKPIGLFDQIREGEDGEWKNELTKTEETPESGSNITFYLRNSTTGEISNSQTVNYKLDKTQPDNKKASPKWVDNGYGQSEWDWVYLGNINGGGRRNNDNYSYHVMLTATDTLSGTAYFQWKYKNSDEWSERVKTEENGEAQISVNYNRWRAGIDIMVCDKAGNLSDEVSVSARNILMVEYDAEKLQRYINNSGEDITEEDLDIDTRLIYNQETKVTFTATADVFDDAAIKVRVNDEPVTVEWAESGSSYIGTIFLAEGNSVVKISAEGYDILSNETGCRIINEEYVSNIHIVDMTNPVVAVTFDSEENTLNHDRKVTVSITDKNFRANELYFSNLTVKDVQGSDVNEFHSADFLNMLKNAVWDTKGDVHSATVTFSVEGTYNFTLEYKDLANNPAAAYQAAPFVIDKSAPDNLQVVYASDPVSTFLQVITFGYYNPSVTVELYADDSVTGVDHFNWTYTQEEGTSITKNVDVESEQINDTDTEYFKYTDQGKTAVATFTLTADEFAQYRGSFSFTATDKAFNKSDIHYGDGKAKDENGNLYDTNQNHVVIVDTIPPSREVTYPEPQQIRSRDTLEVYTGDKAAYMKEENINSIIYYNNTCGDEISIKLKITEANFYAEDVVVKVNEIVYPIDDWSQNGDEWTGTIKLTDDGEYVITVAYTDRSGNSMPFYQSEKIVFDRINPTIDKYKFIPATVDVNVNTATFIDVLEYGYYFKTDFVTEIYASDSLPSSGIDQIAYRLVPYEDGIKQDEITGILPIANGVANLTVPAGFKGQIYAETCDNAGNKSDEVTPQAFVVDKTAPMIDVVSNDTTVYRDAVGNPLYVNDTSVTVTITDMLSGIKEIGYTQNSEKNPAARKNIILNNTGYTVGDNLGDGWMVSAMDANLVTKVTKTFTYNSDDNNIILTIDAIDRSGNKKDGVASNQFTIDKTAPIINIEFRADDETDLYYNENRIADITVMERNFDESRIKTVIENKFGSVPNFTFTEVSNTEHKAVIIFDEGDYTFEMSGTDLGNHTASVNYNGGNERLFYVDKTNPAVTDNFIEFSNQATENSFNEDKTVSISITEHNFDPDLVNLHILRKDAGFSHSTAEMADVTGEFIGSTDWVDNGDVHTVTFTIHADAVYQIEITPADLAGNKAEHKSTVVFEIDKTVPVVSARNGSFVREDDVEFLDVYTYDRREEPAPTIEFSDLNIDYIRYSLTVWVPDYTNSKAMPAVKPEKIYLKDDTAKTGIIKGGRITLPEFTQDGVYTLELTAVDVVGNESILNINTYARLVEQDVLAFIGNSNVKNKTGLYSFQYENGTPISMRPDSFSDLNIFVLAQKNTDVDIVLRDTNAEEIYANAQVNTDNSIYGFTIYNLVLKADFFKDHFSGDTDADLHLAVKNDDKRIDLGRIHIDNVAPTCDLPVDFNSWHWYFGEETRIITLSNINEMLDEKNCKVYDNGKEIDFIYSSDGNTISFELEKGWHSVGIILNDMAGNENNIQEKVNMHVGYFWLWMLAASFLIIVSVAIFILLYSRQKKRILENE